MNIIFGFLEYFRNTAIVQELSRYLKEGDKVIDIGCGNGKLSHELEKIKSIKPIGVDNYVKTNLISFFKNDIENLPFKDKEFDVSLIVDVLHHSTNIKKVLKEASRVSKKVIIKDHFYETNFQKKMLEFADYLFNRPYNIPTPFNFLTIKEWKELFKSLNIKVIKMNENFKINSFDIIKHVFFVVE